jgi:hypothetical protein
VCGIDRLFVARCVGVGTLVAVAVTICVSEYETDTDGEPDRVTEKDTEWVCVFVAAKVDD